MVQSAGVAVKAVLFDFGMVLSKAPAKQVWAEMLTITGLGEKAFDEAYWAPRHEYDRGTLTGAAYWREVAGHAGTTLDDAQVRALIAADTELWTDLNKPMVEWAMQLQRAGVRTGILSNIGDAIAEGICGKLDWLAGFAHCTWSHELKMAKPEPGIYLKTAEALGVEPEAILFIDDKEENIAAAEAVGMQAIRYLDHAEFEQAMRERGLGWLLDAGATAMKAGD